MTALAAALRDICRVLTELHVPFALIGGLAVSARSEPRFTRDIDLAVAVQPSAVDSLGRSLAARGLAIDALLAVDGTNEVAAMRLISGQVRVDLLLGATGLEAEACAQAEKIELFPMVSVPVVTLPYLLLFKLVAVVHRQRRQDEADIEALLEHALPEERERVAALIERLAGTYKTDVQVARHHWLRLGGGAPSHG